MNKAITLITALFLSIGVFAAPNPGDGGKDEDFKPLAAYDKDGNLFVLLDQETAVSKSFLDKKEAGNCSGCLWLMKFNDKGMLVWIKEKTDVLDLLPTLNMERIETNPAKNPLSKPGYFM